MTARRAAKVDASHAAIVKALRRGGASVCSLAAVGTGCPDLLVGVPTATGGETHLVEVKDGAKPPSRRGLPRFQVQFHADWRGAPIAVIASPTAARAWLAERRDA